MSSLEFRTQIRSECGSKVKADLNDRSSDGQDGKIALKGCLKVGKDGTIGLQGRRNVKLDRPEKSSEGKSGGKVSHGMVPGRRRISAVCSSGRGAGWRRISPVCSP